MVGLDPAVSSESNGCHAPLDSFSSCHDLLKDIVLKIFIWILGISAVVGNMFVIVLRLFRRKAARTTPIQSLMITNLALSDLLMGCYLLIIAIADVYYRGDYAINAAEWRGSVVCRVAGYMSTLSSEVSVFLIMLISIDRLLCVVFLHHPQIHLSPKSTIAALVVIWGIGLIVAFPPAVTVNLYGQLFFGRSSVCLGLPLTPERPPGWEYSISIFIVLNLVCFIVTAVCYIKIFVTVHQSRARVAGAKHVANDR